MAAKIVEVQTFTEATGLYPRYSGTDILGSQAAFNRISDRLQAGPDAFSSIALIGEYLIKTSGSEAVGTVHAAAAKRLDDKDTQRVGMLNKYFFEDYQAVAQDILDYPDGVEGFVRYGQLMLSHENVELTNGAQRLVVGRAATMLSGFLEIDDNFRTIVPSTVMITPEKERRERLIELFSTNEQGEPAYNHSFLWSALPMLASKFGISVEQFKGVMNQFRRESSTAYAYAEIGNVVFPFEISKNLYGARPILLSNAGRKIYDAFLDSVALADK